MYHCSILLHNITRLDVAKLHTHTQALACTVNRGRREDNRRLLEKRWVARLSAGVKVSAPLLG